MNYLKTAFFALALTCAAVHTSRAIRLVPQCVSKLFKKELPAPATRIGLIRIDSEINSESGEKLIKKILDFSHDRYIKGVLVIADSGGGSSILSELLFREMKLLSNKKPVVVLAAYCCSAAYHISTAAQWIIAPAVSHVGSIGVVHVLEKHKNYKYDKNGYSADVTFDVMQAGKFKTITYWESAPLTQEERAYQQAQLDESYKTFYTAVAEQRNLSLTNFTDWADGKVFSGTKALELGLIDQIGGYSDSLSKLFELIEKAGTPVDRYTIVE